jgi:hypothetical protein
LRKSWVSIRGLLGIRAQALTSAESTLVYHPPLSIRR